MQISVRTLVLSTVCMVNLLPPGVVRGQERTQLPVLAPTGASAPTATKNHELTVAQVEGAKPAPAPDFLQQETLTGDWNGTRTSWKNKGVELASSLTQFYQGVSSGGTGTSSEYNGTAQAKVDFDFGKL